MGADLARVLIDVVTSSLIDVPDEPNRCGAMTKSGGA